MQQKIFLMSLAILIFTTALSGRTNDFAQTWRELKREVDAQKNSTIVDKGKTINKYEAELTKWLAGFAGSASLTNQQKNEAFAITCHCRKMMLDRLNRLFYKNKRAVDHDLEKHRKECIANIARAKTDYICRKLGMDELTRERLCQKAYEEALEHAKWGFSGKFAYLVNGKLEKKLQAKAPRQKPKKREIYEIYPHEGSSQRQPTLNNISKGKHFRDTACCVCTEPFKTLGKRVNLPCGHDICPRCLCKNKYEYNNHKCPKCRRHISEIDFPEFYLKRNMN